MSKPHFTPPTISVISDLDTGSFDLYASSYGQTMPCGPRLFRASPFPAIAFSHTNQEDAEKDAATLRAYLEDCASGRRKDRGNGVAVGKDYWMKL